MKNKIHITRKLKRVNTFIKRPDKKTRMKQYIKQYNRLTGRYTSYMDSYE